MPHSITAALIISNLDEVTNPVLSSFQFGTAKWQAIAFQTGNEPRGYILTGVDGLFSSLGQYQTGAIPLEPFEARIYPDAGNQPSTGENHTALLGALPKDIHDDNPRTVQFSAPGQGIALESNTKYWLAYTSTSESESEITSVAHPSRTFSYDQSGDSDWDIGNEVFTSLTKGDTWEAGLNFPIQFGIHATPVPEPHQTATLISIILIILACLRRRPSEKARGEFL